MTVPIIRREEEERRSVKLPCTIITIPAPTGLPDRLQLKIYLAPTLSLPTSPFSPSLRSCKQVEESVEVVVPVGGRIAVDLSVRSEGMIGFIESRGVGWDGRTTVLGAIQRAIHQNAAALGLASVQLLPRAIDQHSDDELEDVERTQLQLIPNAANPAIHTRLEKLRLTGEATAYLEKLDIRFVWAPVGERFGRKRQSSLHRGDDDVDGEDEDELVDDSIEDEGEDEIYLDDDGEGDAPTEESGEASSQMRGISHDERGLPRWMQHQLKDGLGRLLRTHLIKSALPAYRPHQLTADAFRSFSTLAYKMHRRPAPTPSTLTTQYSHRLMLPSALSSSMFDFLTLSASYSSDFQERLIKALAEVNKAQMSIIRGQTRRILNLPEMAKAKNEARKRRRVNPERQSSTDSQGAEASTSQAKSVAQVLDKDTRVKIHMRAVKAQRNPPDEAATRRRDERGMRKLLTESVGKIGRYTWAEGRKGRGRLSAFRVPLHLDMDSISVALEGNNDRGPSTAHFEGLADWSDDEFAPEDFEEEDTDAFAEECGGRFPLLDGCADAVWPVGTGGLGIEEDRWEDDDSAILEDELGDGHEREGLGVPLDHEYRDRHTDSPPGTPPLDQDDCDDDEDELVDDSFDDADIAMFRSALASPPSSIGSGLPRALDKMHLEADDEDEIILDDDEDE